jgi:hypothetical protein
MITECFECDGEYKKVVVVYECDTPYGRLKVPDIESEVCNKCGDDILGNDSLVKIDEAMAALKKKKQSDDSIMNSSFGWM